MVDTGTDDTESTRPSRREFIVATGAAGAVAIAGCSGGGSSETPDNAGDGGAGASTDDSEMDGGTAAGTDASGAAWQSVELTTARGDETFTVAGLDGPVVVQSFAVWCPKCQRQSQQLSKLDDSVTVVGLNTDPNEDAAEVRTHAEENGFDWRFAVAPTEMTSSLVETFGPTVTNAPSTPIVVVCDDGSSSFISGGIMPSGELAAAADEC
jgi:thiol-disulfide isomerase/thioredoxin